MLFVEKTNEARMTAYGTEGNIYLAVIVLENSEDTNIGIKNIEIRKRICLGYFLKFKTKLVTKISTKVNGPKILKYSKDLSKKGNKGSKAELKMCDIG